MKESRATLNCIINNNYKDGRTCSRLDCPLLRTCNNQNVKDTVVKINLEKKRNIVL